MEVSPKTYTINMYLGDKYALTCTRFSRITLIFKINGEKRQPYNQVILKVASEDKRIVQSDPAVVNS